MRRTVTITTLLALLSAVLFIPGNAFAKVRVSCTDGADIVQLVEEYIDSFNSYDADGMLELYGQDARISKGRASKLVWLNKEEYRGDLTKKLDKYRKRRVKIVSYELLKLDIEGDTARIELAVRAKQGIFSVKRKGRLELNRNSDEWEIAVDET